MSEVPSVLSDSYEDVLAAVQESARGRWFLEQYAAKLRSGENKTILAAIQKLENYVSEIPVGKKSAPGIEKVKQAIEAARNQIGQLTPEGRPLSSEAQMFAHLSDLARKAFTPNADESLRTGVGKSLEVTLKLVQDLENSFAGTQSAPALAREVIPPDIQIDKPKSAPEQQKFFQQDADIFVPPVQARTPAPSSDKSATEDPSSKGAKFRVLKIDSREPGTAPDSGTAPIEPAAAASSSANHNPIEDASPADNKPRITIIRRKPEELQDVPLAESDRANSAA